MTFSDTAALLPGSHACHSYTHPNVKLTTLRRTTHISGYVDDKKMVVLLTSEMLYTFWVFKFVGRSQLEKDWKPQVNAQRSA